MKNKYKGIWKFLRKSNDVTKSDKESTNSPSEIFKGKVATAICALRQKNRDENTTTINLS